MPTNKVTKILIAGDYIGEDNTSKFERIKDSKKYILDLLHYSRSLEKKNIQKLACRIALDEGYDYILLVNEEALIQDEVFLNYLVSEISQNALDGLLAHPNIRNKKQSFLSRLVDKLLLTLKKKWLPDYISFFPNTFSCYSTKLLRSVPFELNSNGFLFGLELFLQAIHIKAKIRVQSFDKEIPKYTTTLIPR